MSDPIGLLIKSSDSSMFLRYYPEEDEPTSHIRQVRRYTRDVWDPEKKIQNLKLGKVDVSRDPRRFCLLWRRNFQFQKVGNVLKAHL